MLLSFKEAFTLTVKTPDFDAQKYAEIKNALRRRFSEVKGIDQLHDCYEQAIHTAELVEYVHQNFAEKMNSLSRYYKMIRKFPFQQVLVNREPYSVYLFHAAEYQGSSAVFSERVNSIGEQLSLFIKQFLETYPAEVSDKHLDAIVKWTDTLCFDAQIEGRLLNSLMLRLISQPNIESDQDAITKLAKLCKTMDISFCELNTKVSDMAAFLGIEPQAIEDIRSSIDKILRKQTYTM